MTLENFYLTQRLPHERQLNRLPMEQWLTWSGRDAWLYYARGYNSLLHLRYARHKTRTDSSMYRYGWILSSYSRTPYIVSARTGTSAVSRHSKVEIYLCNKCVAYIRFRCYIESVDSRHSSHPLTHHLTSLLSLLYHSPRPIHSTK